MLKSGDRIGLTACSNAVSESDREEIVRLEQCLRAMGLVPVVSPFLFSKGTVFSGTASQRAAVLMAYYADDTIRAIFDLSGGDLANELLGLLDYAFIQSHPKPFWGYSDLTTIINALYARTAHTAYLYQIRNLVREDGKNQTEAFRKTVLQGQNTLFDVRWDFLQGTAMEGTLIGGNIRCFLKLAGTPYLPSFEGKLLFLESLGGTTAQVVTWLNQLSQMGALDKAAGLLLGTFIRLEETDGISTLKKQITDIVADPSLPIAFTADVGHRCTSRCLLIGKKYHIEKGRPLHD